MDDGCTVPFSSVLAGMLLFKRVVSSTEVMHVISDLAKCRIYVDDSDDELDYLSFCVDFEKDCSFVLNENYTYQTVLEDGRILYDFLLDVAGEKVISYLEKNSKYCYDFQYFYKRNQKLVLNNAKSSLKVNIKRKIKSYFVPYFVRRVH